jgi:hypothetical protein
VDNFGDKTVRDAFPGGIPEAPIRRSVWTEPARRSKGHTRVSRETERFRNSDVRKCGNALDKADYLGCVVLRIH